MCPRQRKCEDRWRLQLTIDHVQRAEVELERLVKGTQKRNLCATASGALRRAEAEWIDITNTHITESWCNGEEVRNHGGLSEVSAR